MRIEDNRYLATEGIATLTGNTNLGIVGQHIGLSVLIDLADIKYVRRGVDKDGTPSEEIATLVFIDGEEMDIEEPFELLFDAFLCYKRKWEYEIKD